MSAPFRFPLFVDLSGKRVVIVGGGAVAQRRVEALRPFDPEITVIAPALAGDPAGIAWLRRPYAPGDLEGAFLAVAATDNRSVNRAVGEEARRRGIPVSVADCAGECTFYFPALCVGEQVIAGVVSRGENHPAAAEAARLIRAAWEGQHENSRGKPGQCAGRQADRTGD